MKLLLILLHLSYRKKENCGDSPVKFNRKSNKKRVLDESSDEETNITNKENGHNNKGDLKTEKLCKEQTNKETKSSEKTIDKPSSNSVSKEDAKIKTEVLPPKRKTGIIVEKC